MSTSAEVAVVLINWQKPLEVAATVLGITLQTYRHMRIYIINNGDPSKLRVALLPLADVPVSVIETGRNTGFSGACNLALERASADGVDFLWFLNTDTRLTPTCLSALMTDAGRHAEAGMFSPIVRNDEPGYPVWVAGGRFDANRASFHWFTTEADGLNCAAASPHQLMLPGTALLIRRQAFEQIGPMDERLFAYHEDVDFSIRADRLGINRRLVSNAELFHHHRAGDLPAPHVGYYTARNALLLARKYAPIGIVLRHFYWDFRRLRRESVHPNRDAALYNARALGFWHGLTGVGGEMAAAAAVPRWLSALLGGKG